jgi:uncharacterized protein
MAEVRIPIGGAELGADHFPARGAPPGGRPACVVMAHGFAGTRDSGLPGFAQALADGGLDVLSFDYRGFGTSSGEPRQNLDPARQREDYHAAIAHARGIHPTHPARIVLWGVSYSGGHVFQVGAEDGDVAAVVSVTPAPDGLASFVQALRNGGPRAMLLTVAGIRDQIAALRGGERVLIPAIGEPGTVAPLTAPGALDGMKLMAGPSWRNEVTGRIALIAGSYRPITHAKNLHCPVLVQVADEDRSAPVGAALKAAWAARAEVRHYPCDHFDVYPGRDWFEPVVAHELQFLRRVLA